jgi:prepilin-type N-terminal cleavage/methylation domain-containing protein
MQLKKQAGFTLAEMLVAVFIVGIMAVVASSSNTLNGSIYRATYIQTQTINNQAIGRALKLWAKNDSTLGQLPTPYVGGNYTSGVVNTASSASGDVALQTYLQQQGLSLAEVNSDNYAAQRLRVFQAITGLSKQVPLYVRSGPLVTLTYSFGAVYMTACSITDASCNPGSVPPGQSGQLTAANYQTWNATGTDFGAAFVSTLPLQESMLERTVFRLNTVRSKLLDAYNQRRLGAAPGDTTDWFLASTGSGVMDLSGATASTNQGCYDGWYPLNSATVNVLPQLGLGQSEYSSTAWGGRIEYCRDYDPTYAGALTPPHYAALRIHQSVSTASNPDATVIGNNVIISF